MAQPLKNFFKKKLWKHCFSLGRVMGYSPGNIIVYETERRINSIWNIDKSKQATGKKGWPRPERRKTKPPPKTAYEKTKLGVLAARKWRVWLIKSLPTSLFKILFLRIWCYGEVFGWIQECSWEETGWGPERGGEGWRKIGRRAGSGNEGERRKGKGEREEKRDRGAKLSRNRGLSQAAQEELRGWFLSGCCQPHAISLSPFWRLQKSRGCLCLLGDWIQG